jgi:hypothetical protein
MWGWGRDDMLQLGFESAATNDQQTRLAGKTLTLQRGGRGGATRTITLPRDNRVYVSHPTKLVALQVFGILPKTIANGKNMCLK